MATSNKTGAMPYIKPLLEPCKVIKVHKYYSPGETFKHRGVTYEVLEGKKCKECAFWNKEGYCYKPQSITECCGYSRPDKTWIIFKIKK